MSFKQFSNAKVSLRNLKIINHKPFEWETFVVIKLISFVHQGTV